MSQRLPEGKSAFPVVLILLLPVLVLAAGSASGNNLQDEEAAAMKTSVRILNSLKAIETWLEGVHGKPPPAENSPKPPTIKPGHQDRVRDLLKRNQSSVALLDQLAANAGSEFKQRFGDSPPAAGHAQGQAEFRSLMRIRKYQRIVHETYDRYAALIKDGLPSTSPSTKFQPVIRGTIRAGMGSNTAATEVNGGDRSETQVSRSDVAVDLTADLSAQDRLTLSASRTEEIRFAPISQLRSDINYARRLGTQATLGARAGFDQYQNDANDATNVDRTEFGIRGGYAPSKQFQADADFAVTSASHPNNGSLDYKDSRLNLNANGAASQKVSWAFEYGNAAMDLDDNTITADNSRESIAGKVNIQTGERATLSVLARSDGTAFDGNKNPASYRRQTIEMRGRNRAGIGQSSVWSLAYRNKGFEASTNRNYAEFCGDVQTRNAPGSNSERFTHFFINYRNYKGEDNPAHLDYIEARWDSRRARSSLLWESNTYLQYYLKNGSAERNARISQFLWCGLLLSANQGIAVGPYVATNTDLITVAGSDANAFESKANTVRYGVKGNVRVYAKPVQVDGQARYELSQFYNNKDAAAIGRLELEARASYAVSSRFDASAQIRYYTVGADETGAIKTSEFDLLFGLLYRFGQAR